MAKDMNVVIINGRLVRDPETKQTQGGKNYTNFSVACNNFKDEGMFFNCTAWAGTSDFIAKYFKKGMKIGIEGELQQRSWETEGKKNSMVTINVRSAYFLEKKSDSPAAKVEETFQGETVTNAPAVEGQFDPFDDVPF